MDGKSNKNIEELNKVLDLAKAIDTVDMQHYKKLKFDNFIKEMKTDYPENCSDSPEFEKHLKKYWRSLTENRVEQYYATEDGAEFLKEFYETLFKNYYELSEDGVIYFKKEELDESVISTKSYRELRIDESDKEDFIVDNFYFEMKKFGDMSVINNYNNVNYSNVVDQISKFKG